MSTVIASVILGSAVLLDIVATVLLVRSDVATPLQKMLQVLFIWVLPFVGPIIVIAVVKETPFGVKVRRGSDTSGQTWFAGIGPGSGDAGGFHHGHGGGGGEGGHGGDGGV